MSNDLDNNQMLLIPEDTPDSEDKEIVLKIQEESSNIPEPVGTNLVLFLSSIFSVGLVVLSIFGLAPWAVTLVLVGIFSITVLIYVWRYWKNSDLLLQLQVILSSGTKEPEESEKSEDKKPMGF